MKTRIIGAFIILFNLFGLNQLAKAQSNSPQSHYESINACVMAKFCNDNLGKCKNRCKIRWDEQLLTCINSYDTFNPDNAKSDEFKTPWAVSCRIDKLSSILQQLIPARFENEEKQAQRNRLMTSIKKELDRRFQQFYDEE